MRAGARKSRLSVQCSDGQCVSCSVSKVAPHVPAGLDLLEQERRWDYIQQGRGKEYHGIAVHPRHLSLFERGVLGIHHQYNPELDAEAKKAEAAKNVSQRLQVCREHGRRTVGYVALPTFYIPCLSCNLYNACAVHVLTLQLQLLLLLVLHCGMSYSLRGRV